MKPDALRELSRDELRARIEGMREQLLKLRFQQSTGQIESPQMLRGVRRDIARTSTILRERELGIGPIAAPAPGSVGEAAVEAEAGTED